PLGDPPLFLGFLKGVDFMWTVKHMLMPVLISSVVLLAVFYIIDSRHFNREQSEHLAPAPSDKEEKVKIYGKWNFLLLAGVVGAV
ncbi:sodium:proton antiporter, partial [Neisseria sp. P0001.S005]